MSAPHFILAIDPGTTESQFVVWDRIAEKVFEHGFQRNDVLLANLGPLCDYTHATVIEGVASYGMAVGKEVFETCIWIGRYYQRCTDLGKEPTLLYRLAVKSHLCHSAKAKDANIRQALIDRYGHPGTKKAPGKLYGISSHAWAALALAVTFSETTINHTELKSA
jgi:hypothetical protein